MFVITLNFKSLYIKVNGSCSAQDISFTIYDQKPLIQNHARSWVWLVFQCASVWRENFRFQFSEHLFELPLFKCCNISPRIFISHIQENLLEHTSSFQKFNKINPSILVFVVDGWICNIKVRRSDLNQFIF